jgi:hypothetical protein
VGWQVAGVAALLLIASVTGYSVRSGQLHAQAAASVSPAAPLGDLTAFKGIAADMLRFVRAGDASGAKSRADDLETAWDNGQALLRPTNPDKWTLMDRAIDDVLRKVRAANQDAAASAVSLQAFIKVMDTLGDRTPPAAIQQPPPVAAPVAGAKPLGDLSAYKSIAEGMLHLERAADVASAKSRANDLEATWDKDQPRLQPMSPEKWTLMDTAIDGVLKKVRSPQQNAAASGASLEALIAMIDTLDSQK